MATCVGEEGLDIGEVDLIVCFDAHASPIRLVQRMGRTGRKRDGRIVILVTEGKEEQVRRAVGYMWMGLSLKFEASHNDNRGKRGARLSGLQQREREDDARVALLQGAPYYYSNACKWLS